MILFSSILYRVIGIVLPVMKYYSNLPTFFKLRTYRIIVHIIISDENN